MMAVSKWNVARRATGCLERPTVRGRTRRYSLPLADGEDVSGHTGVRDPLSFSDLGSDETTR